LLISKVSANKNGGFDMDFDAIKKAGESSNPFEKMFLLHDKESLVFCGDSELKFADLS